MKLGTASACRIAPTKVADYICEELRSVCDPRQKDMRIDVAHATRVLANPTIQAGTRESKVAEAAGSVYKNRHIRRMKQEKAVNFRTLPPSSPSSHFAKFSVIFVSMFCTYSFASESLPTVTTQTVVNITGTSASLGATVDGEAKERGVVYTSANTEPVLEGAGVLSLSVPGTTGAFSIPVIGLTRGTLYRFKAYATNEFGTAYSEPGYFFTYDVPTVQVANNLNRSSVPTGFEIEAEEGLGLPVTEQGVVLAIGEGSSPTVGERWTIKVEAREENWPSWTIGSTVSGSWLISGWGGFRSTKMIARISSLNPGTKYSYRAYAINSVGVGYSSTYTFTTLLSEGFVARTGGLVRQSTFTDSWTVLNDTPKGAIWKSLGPPMLNNKGDVAFRGTWKAGSETGTGVFRLKGDEAYPADPFAVAKVGEPVPGLDGATIKSVMDPVLDEVGGLAFRAKIQGKGVHAGNDEVILHCYDTDTYYYVSVTELRRGALVVAAREGAEAPGANGARWSSFQDVSLVRNGSYRSRILFTASLREGTGRPSVTTSTNQGAWVFLFGEPSVTHKVVREGDMVPGVESGERIKSFQLLAHTTGPRGHGTSHNPLNLVFPSKTTKGRKVLLGSSGDTPELRIVASEGGALDEKNSQGPKWVSFGRMRQNKNGELVMLGTISNGSARGGIPAILASDATGDHWTPIVQLGDFPPSGSWLYGFTGFSDPVIGDKSLSFIGTAKGGYGHRKSVSGIFTYPLVDSVASPLASIVEEPLVPSVRPPTYPIMKFHETVSPGGDIPAVFAGEFKVGAKKAKGIMAVSSSGYRKMVITEGGHYPPPGAFSSGGKTVKHFDIFETVRGSQSAIRAFNGRNLLVWRATFDDNSTAIIRTRMSDAPID